MQFLKKIYYTIAKDNNQMQHMREKAIRNFL